MKSVFSLNLKDTCPYLHNIRLYQIPWRLNLEATIQMYYKHMRV